jgi:hypothetical protein
MHQLAFAACGYRFRQKLTGDDLRAEDMASCSLFDSLSEGGSRNHKKDAEFQQLEQVEASLMTLRAFLNSADTEISHNHLPHPLPQILMERGAAFQEKVVVVVKELWRRMCDVADSEIRMTHSGYLKLYSLSKPRLKFDVVMLDEAQDCNPAIADVVVSQSCARILVGDKHQAIYGFLGAQDMLGRSRLESGQRSEVVMCRQLTRSFRFGENIADLANFLLRYFTGEGRPLLGCGRGRGELLQSAHELPAPPFAFIARTNTSVLMQALRADELGLTLEWIGGVKGYKLGLIQDLCLLALGRREEVDSRRVKAFPSLPALRSFAKRIEDRELVQRTELVMRSSPEDLLQRMHNLVVVAERREKSQCPVRADVSLSTVHKAKGLEWDKVVVADDFLDMQEELGRVSPNGWSGDVQELNMLYVALTRCKQELHLPQDLFTLYTPQAEAVAVAFPCGHRGCLACGRPLQEASSHARVVGSVSLRAICSSCYH